MARSDQQKVRDRARARTHAFYYGGLWPPRFLVEDSGDRSLKAWQARRQAVLQAAWEASRALLGERPAQQRTGYPALLALEQSLEARFAELEETVSHAKGYLAFYERGIRLVREDGRQHGMETHLGQVFPDSIPIGSEAWERGWEKPVIGGRPDDEPGDGERASPGETITFEIRKAPEGNAPGGLAPEEAFIFDVSQTFRDVLVSVQQRYQTIERTYKRWRDTQQLVAFRLAVMRNVRWQFDLFGVVEPLTPEAAGQMLRQTRSGRHPVVDVEEVERLLWGLAENSSLRHRGGQRQGTFNVTAVVRALERDYDVFDGVSGRRAREIVGKLLRKMGLL